MKIDWLTMLIIFIPSLTTLIGAYWQVKTMKELQSNTSKLETEITITLKRKFIKYIAEHFPLLIKVNIVLYILGLVWELTKTNITSRWTVLVIVIYCSFIVFNVIIGMVIPIFSKILNLIKEIIEIIKKLVTQISNLQGSVDEKDIN